MITLALAAGLAFTGYSVRFILSRKPTDCDVWLTVASTTYRVGSREHIATIEVRA